MGSYERLGVPDVINADGNMTTLGGSLMPRVVLEAMVDAAQHYVDIVELRTRVGSVRRIAEES